MLILDTGTPLRETLPMRQQFVRKSINGATPGILNGDQTLNWTRRCVERHANVENATCDALLWEPMGLQEGSEVRLLLHSQNILRGTLTREAFCLCSRY
jgi:hypothetical protein